MRLCVDSSSAEPLYLQLVRQVRLAFATGRLRRGDRLPTVRDIASAAGVNRNTAARAVRHLEREGLVRSRVGQGTFVTEPGERVDPRRRERALDGAIDRLLVEAHALGVPVEELGWRLTRRIEAFRRGSP